MILRLVWCALLAASIGAAVWYFAGSGDNREGALAVVAGALLAQIYLDRAHPDWRPKLRRSR